MGPITLGILGIVFLLVLLFFGMKIGIAMLIVGVAGYTYVTGNFNAAVGLLKSVPYTTAASFSLSVIPMFVFMGQIAYESGISGDLYAACYNWFGRVKGGLAVATVVACAGFAAICGSSTATTATMGVVCLPEMRKYGYKDTLSTGCISAGGTLGILIPPSVGFILYGTTAEIGVGKLFTAGIVPGILLAILYIIVIVVICKMDAEAGPRGPKFPLKQKVKSLKGVLPILILFIIVLGGIFTGWFTANEGGAIGAFGAFVFMIIRRKATMQNIIRALRDTLNTTAMIFLIMIGAYVFGAFLTVSNCPSTLANWAAGLNVSPYIILIFILLIYGLLGCFVDSLPLIVLLVPIFLPIIKALGFDPIWFGVLMVMIMQLGLITPPVGMCCYVMAGVAKDVPLGKIFRGTAPFIVGLVLAVALVIIIPQLALWLPGLMWG
ncbi:MAG: TRAP transporter large permease [Oscillospiraceae bacterium]|nr:TRAP transporter large permease [Oscillospiraceae bacterium]